MKAAISFFLLVAAFLLRLRPHGSGLTRTGRVF